MSWPRVGRERSDWLTKLRRCTVSDISCDQLAAALEGTAACPGRAAAGSQIKPTGSSVLPCLFRPSVGVAAGHFLSAPSSDVRQECLAAVGFLVLRGRTGGVVVVVVSGLEGGQLHQ